MKYKIAILGGSHRERIIAESLRDNHFSVATYALENMDHIDANSPENCVTEAAALILPVRSNDKNVKIDGTPPLTLTEELFRRLSPNAVIYCGIGSKHLREMAKHSQHPLIEIMEDDNVAIPNAVLTAEGTLGYIMEHSKVSLGEIYLNIFGFGRVGKACADLFTAVGCKVTVFCRKETDLQKGRELGYDMRYYTGIGAVLPKTDVLINTVPSVIIKETEIKLLKENGKIIDLASMPGGVDLEAAERYGIESVMMPGLPGKYAPITAGRILASYYLRELREFKEGDR